MGRDEVHVWVIDEGVVSVSSHGAGVRLELQGDSVSASLRDAGELAGLIELHARALWDSGVRDASPRAVELGEARGRWPQADGLFEVSRDGERVRFVSKPRAVVELRLGAAVELVQVLRWLAPHT
jgi:hypothetical protein